MPDPGDKASAFTSGWAKLKSSLFEMDSLDSVEVLLAIEEAFDVIIFGCRSRENDDATICHRLALASRVQQRA
jgi:hypothetical protein